MHNGTFDGDEEGVHEAPTDAFLTVKALGDFLYEDAPELKRDFETGLTVGHGLLREQVESNGGTLPILTVAENKAAKQSCVEILYGANPSQEDDGHYFNAIGFLSEDVVHKDTFMTGASVIHQFYKGVEDGRALNKQFNV